MQVQFEMEHIEVPLLLDPLLTLYQSSASKAFYFQQQHPFVYSANSIKSVLEFNSLNVLELRPYQRYGLENHIGWLKNAKPGGYAELADVCVDADVAYKSALEAKRLTDTIFASAEVV